MSSVSTGNSIKHKLSETSETINPSNSTKHQTLDFDFNYEEDLNVTFNRAIMQNTVHTALNKALDQVYQYLRDLRSEFDSHQTQSQTHFEQCFNSIFQLDTRLHTIEQSSQNAQFYQNHIVNADRKYETLQSSLSELQSRFTKLQSQVDNIIEGDFIKQLYKNQRSIDKLEKKLNQLTLRLKDQVLNYNTHTQHTKMQLKKFSNKIDSLGNKLDKIRDRCLNKIDSGASLQAKWNCKTEDKIQNMNQAINEGASKQQIIEFKMEQYSQFNQTQ